MELNGKTILVVDDDRIIGMAQASFFSKFGYNVITAGCGEEVLAVIESGSPPDVVLLDLDLGDGAGGPEIAEHIFKQRDIPVVFISSYNDSITFQRIKYIKKYGYIPKNSGDYVILSAVETALELFYERKSACAAGINTQQTAEFSQNIIRLSDNKGLCTWFNKSWLLFTGRDLDQEKGDGWADGIHPDDREKIISEFASAVKGRESFLFEYRLKRVDGEYRWIMDKGEPVYSTEKIFEGHISSCIDITAKKGV